MGSKWSNYDPVAARNGFYEMLEMDNKVLGRKANDRDLNVAVGWVYFVMAPEINRVKIGHTGDHPDRRLNGLRQNIPFDLVPLGILRGSTYLEAQVHQVFRPMLWKREWFHDHPLLRDFIADIASTWLTADEVNCYREIQSFAAARMIRQTILRMAEWIEVHRAAMNAAKGGQSP